MLTYTMTLKDDSGVQRERLFGSPDTSLEVEVVLKDEFAEGVWSAVAEIWWTGSYEINCIIVTYRAKDQNYKLQTYKAYIPGKQVISIVQQVKEG